MKPVQNYIIMALQSIKNKKNILKVIREKKQITEKRIRLASDFYQQHQTQEIVEHVEKTAL